MKKIKMFVVLFPLALIAFASCKKQPYEFQQQTNKKRPVANAGIDQAIILPADSTILNGSGTDEDGNIVKYNWRKISGPISGFILNPNLAKTEIKNLVSGVYVFELEVTDSDGLTAFAYMKIFVSSTCAPAHTIDITLINTYSFKDNYYNPWDYGAPNINGYYDLTEINGKGVIQPLGDFNIYILEYADSAALSDSIHGDYFQFSNGVSENISGNFSMNFKKLIRDGGGSFNGTFTIIRGSAEQTCNVNNFKSLPPLTVTGSLDVATQIVTLRIYGKVYF